MTKNQNFTYIIYNKYFKLHNYDQHFSTKYHVVPVQGSCRATTTYVSRIGHRPALTEPDPEYSGKTVFPIPLLSRSQRSLSCDQLEKTDGR